MIHSNEYYNGQALQDKFVLNMLKYKCNGFFLEIGSNNPREINNTYLLEKEYNWKGIMIDYDTTYLESYTLERPNSSYVINDATSIDYVDLLSMNKCPRNADYLQIDLEPGNGSTLKTLEILDKTIFDNYTFATVTFEHDIYIGNSDNKSIFHETRNKSRLIFEKRGYIRVLSDINNDGWWDIEGNRKLLRNGENMNTIANTYTSGLYPFEDWYVHPSLIDMEYVNSFIEKNKSNYFIHPSCGTTINFNAIQYS
jgi:hypothetical protein